MDDYPPSLLDRLTDPELPPGCGRYTALQTEQAVLRDLADLLNTKRPPEGSYTGLPLVATSVVNFGLKDMTLAAHSPEQRAEYAKHIKDVIAAHEPRLTRVEVSPRNPEDVMSESRAEFNLAAVYFRIRATLNVDPVPIEGVTFDTVLELATGHHNVNLGGGGA